jgi:hypothetical protein
MPNGAFLIVGHADDSYCARVAEALEQLGHDVIRTTDPLTRPFAVHRRLGTEPSDDSDSKNWKIEKWEGSKLETIKSELGKFEHGELKGGFEPGPDPRQLGSKIEELITEVSELKAEVAQLRGAARKGRVE